MINYMFAFTFMTVVSLLGLPLSPLVSLAWAGQPGTEAPHQEANSPHNPISPPQPSILSTSREVGMRVEGIFYRSKCSLLSCFFGKKPQPRMPKYPPLNQKANPPKRQKPSSGNTVRFPKDDQKLVTTIEYVRDEKEFNSQFRGPNDQVVQVPGMNSTLKREMDHRRRYTVPDSHGFSASSTGDLVWNDVTKTWESRSLNREVQPSMRVGRFTQFYGPSTFPEELHRPLSIESYPSDDD